MKNILFLLGLFVCGCFVAMADTPVYLDETKPVEERIDDALNRMTLDEKIGQMCEITVDVITDFSSPNAFKISETKLDTVIGQYKVGSILNVPLSVAQKKEVWAEAIRQIQEK